MAGNWWENWSMEDLPKLSKDYFNSWKMKMIAFLGIVNSNLLTTIEEGPYVPQVLIPAVLATANAPGIPARYRAKERKDWSHDDFEKVALEHTANYMIIMSLPDDIFHLLINLKTAKEIWDYLIVFFEGTDEVRKHKGYLLVRQYEVFTSKPGESITEIYCRFSCLLNDLRRHDKVFDEADVAIKFLDSLPPKWAAESAFYKLVTNLKKLSLEIVYDILLAQEIWKEKEKQTKKKVVVKEKEYYNYKA